MLKTKLAYRPSGYQLPVISIIQEHKLYQQFGLEAELSLAQTSEIAEDLLLRGEIQFIIGNHIVPMSDRVKGVPLIYMAQATNWSLDRLVTWQPGINSLKDMKGKRITFGPARDSHPSLTKRLCAMQAGLDLAKDVEVVPIEGNDMAELQAIYDRKIDAALLSSPFDLRARRMGLRVLETPAVPMVCGMTVCTMSPFAKENGDLVKRVVQTLSAGIHRFRTDKKEAFSVMKARLGKSTRLQLDDDELIEHLYNDSVELMDKKLYPTTQAIQNVYQAALILHPEVKSLNPLSMWDLHYTRELDEEGFFDKLYRA
ncbi:MAG: aliphatic sulfonates family transporter, periplasmic ligand-binding protein [Dehalococcoidia bacterium]|nr:aliphatic sulfonates family transporter, periplasmic ligand-binding protein [Dehalococcoidia bacterium]